MMKKIFVSAKHPNHNRAVRFYVFDMANLDSSVLSEIKINDVTAIINDLTSLESNPGPNAYYEWGVDEYSVFSTPTTSSCTNEIEGIALPDVSTRSLLNLMIAIRHFKQQYQDSTNLHNIIGQAFIAIKANPDQYRIAPAGTYYDTNVNEITISMNLSNDDCNLDIDAFLHQLATDC